MSAPLILLPWVRTNVRRYFYPARAAGFSCVLDLSNPIAVEWFHGNLRALQEKYDIDGFKFDAGDPYMYRGGDRSAQMQLPLDCTADYARFVSEYPFNELRAVWNMGGRPWFAAYRTRYILGVRTRAWEPDIW